MQTIRKEESTQNANACAKEYAVILNKRAIRVMLRTEAGQTKNEGIVMKKRYLLGIDVGTTGVKVIAFDLAGCPVASAYEEYACFYPHEGWVEQDCNLLIHAVYRCCMRVLGDANIHKSQIYSVSVSAQRSSMVLFDRNGQPIRLISWLDNRAVEEVEEITEKIGRSRFYEITGLPLSPTWILPKLMHIRRHEPALWECVGKVTQVHDLILRALGVEGYYTDEPEACFFGLWDSKQLCFSKELLTAFNIDRTLLPEVRQVGEVVGTISTSAAMLTGLAEQTLICIGLGDQNSAAIGAGVVCPGDVSVSLGTGGLATVMLPSCYRDPNEKAMVTSHAIHGMWTFEGLQNVAAGGFRWFRDQIGALEKAQAEREGKNPYDVLYQMIEKTPIGANGVLMMPHFAGASAPRWDSAARAGFLGLTLAHGRAEMARACVEGITMEQKDILRSISLSGLTLSKVRIVGGATKSEVWNQMQADIYNLPCETVKVADAAALGAAISAGVGAGVFQSIEEGASFMVRRNQCYEPDLERAARYEELYQIYCDAYLALQQSGVFTRLSSF